MSDQDPIATLPPLREVIREAGLQATKKLGQNFLLDLNLTASIAKIGGDLSGLDIIEVGPGPGGLTRALLQGKARSVHAIEFDSRAVLALQPLQEAAEGRLHIHEADALETSFLDLGQDGSRAIAANLPYNIATPLLVGFLKDIRLHGDKAYRFMLLMFQKEVAERIVAGPGSKTYGRLSVLTQWLTKSRIAKTLPPGAFTPPPKVHSSVVHFIPKVLESDAPAFATMEKILASAFNQRRKMLRSSLKEYVALLDQAGIDPTLRAEDVPADDYVRLAKLVEAGI